MTTTDEVVQTPAIPQRLIRETMNGQPLYYKGYRDVLAGLVQPEEIMGSSDLQSLIVMTIAATIWNRIDRKQYKMAVSEPGLHVDRGNNFAADIAIFDKATLPPIKGKYFDVPPKVVIEVDIRIDWNESENDLNYVLDKSRTLFNFGVERVIWILTGSRTVAVMQPAKDGIITDWSNDITVLEGCVLNIKTLLDEEEIIF